MPRFHHGFMWHHRSPNSIALVKTRPSDAHIFSVGYLTPGFCKDPGGHESHEHQPRSWLLLGTDPDMAHRHSLGPISTMALCSIAGYPDLHNIGLAWSPDTNIATGDHSDTGLLYSLMWGHGLCTSTQNSIMVGPQIQTSVCGS